MIQRSGIHRSDEDPGCMVVGIVGHYVGWTELHSCPHCQLKNFVYQVRNVCLECQSSGCTEVTKIAGDVVVAD